eukprot:SAG31_NODE_2451_length_5667_cov_5.877694_5_plen_326_part_00
MHLTFSRSGTRGKQPGSLKHVTAAELQGLKGKLLQKARTDVTALHERVQQLQDDLSRIWSKYDEAATNAAELRESNALLHRTIEGLARQRDTAVFEAHRLRVQLEQAAHSAAQTTQQLQQLQRCSEEGASKLRTALQQCGLAEAELDAERAHSQHLQTQLEKVNHQADANARALDTVKQASIDLQLQLEQCQTKSACSLVKMADMREVAAARESQVHQMGAEVERLRSESTKWRLERDNQIEAARRQLAASRADGSHSFAQHGSATGAQEDAGLLASLQYFRDQVEFLQEQNQKLRGKVAKSGAATQLEASFMCATCRPLYQVLS